LAEIYESVSGHGFGNLTGDALEIIVFKCLQEVFATHKRYSFAGQFFLSEQKNAEGRFRKSQPPRSLNGKSITTEADFIQFGHDAGPLCIECKNLREWIYPTDESLKELIIKASGLSTIPVLIARRIHYSTLKNFLEPAGIIAHESYFQYYPSSKHALAAQAKDKNLLGFTDVMPTEDPHDRTRRFMSGMLPSIVERMAGRWYRHEQILLDYANDEINLAQLYTAIGSRAGGKWRDFDEEDQDIPM